jgi:hypothetical protein
MLTFALRSRTMAAMGALRWWRAAFGVTTVVVAACGARTELELDTPAPPSILDAGPDIKDAGPDIKDAGPDVPPLTCEEAGVTFIYVVSSQNTLFSYYPPSGVFTPLGTINCPGTFGATPFSMAVDRGGTAYVVFTDGQLFRVSTATAACKATGFVPGQSGFGTFGMGFSSNTDDPGETLFVAASPSTGTSAGLASIDTSTLDLSFIGPFSSPLGRTELTGTGDGRLFGFSIDTSGAGSFLSEIDGTTAKILSSKPISVGGPSDAFAYAFWGDAFYFFTASGGAPTQVTRYNPQDQSLVTVGSLIDTIVGAGVSTCAPN